MSQTASVQMDPYLASAGATMPPNDLTVDPKYNNIQLVTPIGRLAYASVDKPRAFKQPNGEMGPESFSVTMLMNPAATMDIYRAIVAVANAAFPTENMPDPANPSMMIPTTGEMRLFRDQRIGGLHYPLRQGDENYMKDPVKFEKWRGLFFINAGIAAINPTSKASQQPVVLDELGHPANPNVVYGGCYARLVVTVYAFGTANSRNREVRAKGITLSLRTVQFASHGERMGGFNALAAAQTAVRAAGAIAANPYAPAPQEPGVGGPHTAGAGSVPPGAAMPPAGWAAPPAPQPVAGPATAAPGQMQQPWTPPAGGARPPGV